MGKHLTEADVRRIVRAERAERADHAARADTEVLRGVTHTCGHVGNHPALFMYDCPACMYLYGRKLEREGR